MTQRKVLIQARPTARLTVGAVIALAGTIALTARTPAVVFEPAHGPSTMPMAPQPASMPSQSSMPPMPQLLPVNPPAPVVPVQLPPTTSSGERQYIGAPLSLDFAGADLRSV
ncbi:MAG: hypothetical protein H0U19_14845, partial [Acidobacteria bacterium]|nr:hypothetical protein [Acidobacteriota bacterium]